MSLQTTKIGFTSNEWHIYLDKKATVQSAIIFFKERNEFLRPARQFELNVSNTGDETYVSIPLELIAKNALLDRQTVWQIELDGHKIQASEDKLLESFSNDFHSHEFSIQDGFLVLLSHPTPIHVYLTDFHLDASEVRGKLQIETTFDISGYEAILSVKKRIRPELYLFHGYSQNFKLGNVANNQLSFEIDTEVLSDDFLVDETNNLDPVLILQSSVTKSAPLFIEVSEALKDKLSVKKQIKSDRTLQSYRTGSNRLSFYLLKESEKVATLTEFKNSEQAFLLTFAFETQLDEPTLVIKRQDKKFSTFEHVTEMAFSIKKRFKNYSVKLKKSALYPFHSYNPDENWDMFIRSGSKEYPLFVSESIQFSKDYIRINNNQYQVRWRKKADSTIRLRFVSAPILKAKPKKLVVMGTCFSRNAFNSDPFFNPDYKSFFSVMYTQMHTSLISAMTNRYNQPLKLKNYASGLTKAEFGFLEDEFRKDLFDRLRKIKPDYFIIDLYPDAIRPVIWLDDQTAITFSYFLEQTKLADELPCHRLMDHSNDDAFFEEWTHYADLFIAEIKKIIPEERIILNKGGFTLTYYDENHNIKSYPYQMGIQKAQFLWDRMNNYFLSQAPNVRVIDFSNKGYIGDYYYPFGHSFSHFESDYYKDFLKEMIYIDQTDSFL